MNFDEETLIEIEDYIQALDENVGLKPETVIDINTAITKQRKLVKKINYEPVLEVVSCVGCGPELNEQEKECLKSPDGKHKYVLPPDSFDSPYCKYCYKGS